MGAKIIKTIHVLCIGLLCGMFGSAGSFAAPAEPAPDMSTYPVLDMATIPRPKPIDASLPANLGEAIQRIEAQLAQYPGFNRTVKPRGVGKQLLDLVTFRPTEAPKAIDRFETVDVPFFKECIASFAYFLDNDTLICSGSTNKKPQTKEEPPYYRLSYEINLKTGQVIPHPELSYDFPGLPAMGEIKCYDPISKYMQINVVSQKSGEEKIYLRGYWGGKVEAYLRDAEHWMINEYTCQNIQNLIIDKEIGQQGTGSYEYMRDGDGLIINPRGSYFSKSKLEKALNEKGISNYFLYYDGWSDKAPFLNFMGAYMFNTNTDDCIKGKGVKINFWSKQGGVWSWPVPDEITRKPNERGCNTLYGRAVKPGMLWLHNSHSDDTKGINFQYWDKPNEVIHLAGGYSTPEISSPDGCYLIYAHFYSTWNSASLSGANPNIYQYRLTNFCNPKK